MDLPPLVFHFVSGLASHFRDLMVCKNQETMQLLEVGDETKLKYLEQSKKTSFSFLLKAIELTNECGFKYKSSKNQRLLVELCLMQLASINFDGEKKNDGPFIIPAIHFHQNGSSIKTPIKEHQTKSVDTSVKEIQVDTKKEELPTVQEPVSIPKIEIKTPSEKRVSGLSLSSIHAKNEHKKK